MYNLWTTVVVWWACLALAVLVAVAQSASGHVLSASFAPEASGQQSMPSHNRNDGPTMSDLLQFALQKKAVENSGKLGAIRSLVGHTFNVSGVLTIHGLVNPFHPNHLQLTCNKTLHKMVKDICKPRDGPSESALTRKSRSTAANSSPQYASFLDFPAIRAYLTLPDHRSPQTLESLDLELFKRSVFDPQFVKARIETIIGECCDHQRHCSNVKQQFEDACHPGAQTGIRTILST